MSRFLPVIIFFYLFACSHFDTVQYQPNPKSQNPKQTIDRILKEQPQSWGNVPYFVSIKDDRIDMQIMEESSPLGIPMMNSSYEIFRTIYYKLVGKTIIHKHSSGVWYVEIYDTLNQYIYSVNCYSEADAKAFIDALYTMKSRQY